MGLVDRVVPCEGYLDAALEWAGSLASGAVVAMGLAKRAVDGGLDGSLADGLDLERTPVRPGPRHRGRRHRHQELLRERPREGDLLRPLAFARMSIEVRHRRRGPGRATPPPPSPPGSAPRSP